MKTLDRLFVAVEESCTRRCSFDDLGKLGVSTTRKIGRQNAHRRSDAVRSTSTDSISSRRHDVHFDRSDGIDTPHSWQTASGAVSRSRYGSCASRPLSRYPALRYRSGTRVRLHSGYDSPSSRSSSECSVTRQVASDSYLNLRRRGVSRRYSSRSRPNYSYPTEKNIQSPWGNDAEDPSSVRRHTLPLDNCPQQTSLTPAVHTYPTHRISSP